MARRFSFEQKDHLSTTTRTDAIDLIFKSRITSFEFADFFLGDYLGGGSSRDVFAYAPDPKRFVVKIQRTSGADNILEHNVWSSIRHAQKFSKWFAPIERISPCGKILLMRRAKTCESPEKYPAKIPSFFADIKRDNFGFIGDQFVCVDYALNMIIEENYFKANKLRAADWDKR